jgi:hypothetical protein
MTARHAALGSVVPYYAWVPSNIYSALTRASEHRRLKLLITLSVHTKAPFLCPDNCSAYATSRSYRTPAVPRDMQTLATFACACNEGVLPVTRTPLAEA